MQQTDITHLRWRYLNPLQCKVNYGATQNNMKLVHSHRVMYAVVHWPLMGGLLYLVQRAGNWAGPQLAHSLLCCTKCNSPPINGQCTNHRNVAVLLHNGPLLCGFNVSVKGVNNVGWWADKIAFQTDVKAYTIIENENQLPATLRNWERCNVVNSG